MKVKYFPQAARPKGWLDDDDDWVQPSSPVTVIVEDRTPKDTGLLDASGTTIYRQFIPSPIGFCRKESD